MQRHGFTFLSSEDHYVHVTDVVGCETKMLHAEEGNGSHYRQPQGDKIIGRRLTVPSEDLQRSQGYY